MTPVYVATWRFGAEACEVGGALLAKGATALDAVEKGANAVELNPEVDSVGYGGMPNAEGIVELDAAIMDGPTHACGSIAGLTGIRRPISVARRIMERTPHVMLVGENGKRFALQQGFVEEDLLTDKTRRLWKEWTQHRTGPEVAHFGPRQTDSANHDTIGVLALDQHGNLAAGCTTSGLRWKLPGRVGDSPIIGSGLYVDNLVGCAAATGNGDEMMKVCLSYRVVNFMEQGRSPQQACEDAIRYLQRKRPGAQGQGAACIALGRDGRIGAAATRTGFHKPNDLWIFAHCSGGKTQVEEGVYVDEVAQ